MEREGKMKQAWNLCRIPITVLTAVLLALPVANGSAAAEVVVHDDFDDAVLDPAWEVNLQDALGWTYEESGTSITVANIEPEFINHTSGGPWAIVSLSQTFPALSDFHVDFELAWDCLGSNAAMQQHLIFLHDSNGEAVVGVGFSDQWVGARACRYALIGSTTQCVANELPFSGSASVDIDRTGDLVTILWDEVAILSEGLSVHIAGVEIVFSFNAYDGPPTDSIFGTESVDLVTVEGDLTAVDRVGWGAVKRAYR